MFKIFIKYFFPLVAVGLIVFAVKFVIESQPKESKPELEKQPPAFALKQGLKRKRARAKQKIF